MASEQEKILAGIAALEAQRALLGDAVVDASIAALRSKIDALATTPRDEPAQTLRQVSILFLDVVGSTTLSQHLDPEDIHKVLDNALARCTTVVQAHQGRVLQYAGDNLLAAFGAVEAKEDDAESAVRCGLALLAQGRALGGEVQAAHNYVGFDVRVGIHTGGVLLGGGVDAEGTIRGIAVNIAARMEQSAPAGALRISQDTYALVRGIFDVEPQDPILVKGVDAPIHSYLVQRAKPRAFRIATRGVEGVATRMIGRDAELESLQQAFKRLFAERSLAAVTVVAEAGVGKSRLLTEFEAWSESRPESYFIFRGRANPNGQAQPYGVLRDILAWRLQISDNDTLEAAKSKIEQGIVPLFVQDEGEDQAEGHAHLLGHLLGIDYSESRHIRGIRDDPRQIRNRAFHTASQVFRRVSASDGSPIVLQLEDLHWADDASLDFVTYLMQVNRDVPMLILALARPTLYDRQADWMSAERIHQRIDLKPLDQTGGRLLANEILKKLPEVPAALREMVTGGSEGNPFYMEELVKMLIDQGAIETGGPHSERWTLHVEKLLSATVPPTLVGVLQSRLDGLPAAERLALQQASVIGAVFWDRALIALDERAEQALPALVRRELALPHASALVENGVREYAFRHHILHQVTYDTVLKRTRRELHDKVAHWLSGLSGLHASDFLGIAAEHYERAGDTVNAAEYHTRAAEHALSRFAHEAALDHAQRAAALLGPTAQAYPRAFISSHLESLKMRWRLLDVRERILDLQARRPEQQKVIDDMSALAEALDDDGRRAYAAYRLSGIAQFRPDGVSLSASSARRAITFAERAGDDVLRLSAIARLAYALSHVEPGEVEAVKALAQHGLAESREKRLRLNEAKLASSLARIALRQGDLMGHLELRRLCLALHREVGDRSSEALAVGNMGAALRELGVLEGARTNTEEAVRLSRTNGDRAGECMGLVILSGIVRQLGNHTRALSLARSGLELATAINMHVWDVYALFELGEAELALGRHDAAARAFEQALGGATRDQIRHQATAGLARSALAQGNAERALQAVEELVESAAAGGAASFDRAIELTCHMVLAAVGDPRATEWLQIAHSNLQNDAAAITDADMRRSFLGNIPEHREIEAAWAAGRQSSGGVSDVP